MKQQVRHVQAPVIGQSLVECLLRQRYRFGFAFDEHERLHLTVINDGIASFEHVSYADSHLYACERKRISKLLHHMVKQLLANPLFGRQSNPAMTPVAKNLFLVFVYARAHYLR